MAIEIVGTEVKITQPIYLAKFSWDLTTQMIVREVDPCEACEITNTRRDLTMQIEQLEVQCNNTR